MYLLEGKSKGIQLKELKEPGLCFLQVQVVLHEDEFNEKLHRAWFTILAHYAKIQNLYDANLCALAKSDSCMLSM